MRAKRFPSLLGLAFLGAVGLAAAQPAHEASAATASSGYGDHGFEYMYDCGYGGPYQAQWQYQWMGSSSLGTGPAAYPTAIIMID